MIDDHERKFRREMQNRLYLYEEERRRSYKIHIRPPQPEINVLAFKVALEANHKRTFRKILRELVKYRDELRPDVRRYLVECLRIGSRGARAFVLGKARTRFSQCAGTERRYAA
jgi:hypothetical protein